MQKIGLVTLFDVEDERYLAYLASNTRLFILECENKPVIHRTPSLCYFFVREPAHTLGICEKPYRKACSPSLEALRCFVIREFDEEVKYCTKCWGKLHRCGPERGKRWKPGKPKV